MRVDILEQHAEEVALIWALRDAAAKDPHYDLHDLARLDERLEAHVDALRIAGEAAWGVVNGILEAQLDEDHAGEVFAAAFVATERFDVEALARILDAAGDSPALRRGLVSAMGWSTTEDLERILPALLDSGCPPALTTLGIDAAVAHRLDPGDVLVYGIHADDIGLRRRALRACGLLGRTDLAEGVRAHLDESDDACRYQSAAALALFGDVGASVDALFRVASSPSVYAERALVLAMRRASLDYARTRLRDVERFDDGSRRLLLAIGATGDSTAAAQLVSAMATPALARVAGEAFTLVTGADLGSRPLRGAKPAGFVAGPTDDAADEAVEPDPDANLPWPDAAAVEGWWKAKRAAFSRTERYLLGKPISAPWTSDVLRSGYQRQRAAAALESVMLRGGRPVFEVRAPGARQLAALGGGTR